MTLSTEDTLPEGIQILGSKTVKACDATFHLVMISLTKAESFGRRVVPVRGGLIYMFIPQQHRTLQYFSSSHCMYQQHYINLVLLSEMHSEPQNFYTII